MNYRFSPIGLLFSPIKERLDMLPPRQSKKVCNADRSYSSGGQLRRGSAPDCPCNLKLFTRRAKPLWFRPLCFSENDGSVLLHLAPTPDGAGLTKGRKQDTCGSESWQIHRAVVCLPEPPVPDAGPRDSHKLSVWKRSVSPKTDRPPWQRWRLGPCTPGGCGAGR